MTQFQTDVIPLSCGRGARGEGFTDFHVTSVKTLHLFHDIEWIAIALVMTLVVARLQRSIGEIGTI